MPAGVPYPVAAFWSLMLITGGDYVGESATPGLTQVKLFDHVTKSAPSALYRLITPQYALDVAAFADLYEFLRATVLPKVAKYAQAWRAPVGSAPAGSPEYARTVEALAHRIDFTLSMLSQDGRPLSPLAAKFGFTIDAKLRLRAAQAALAGKPLPSASARTRDRLIDEARDAIRASMQPPDDDVHARDMKHALGDDDEAVTRTLDGDDDNMKRTLDDDEVSAAVRQRVN